MDRVQFIMDALEINQVQATIVDKLLGDIPDSKLPDFIVYRMDFIQPMKSKDLITKEAIYSYKKTMLLNKIHRGLHKFNSVSEIKKFCQTYFRGEELCNGADGYYDYVVIGMDRDGMLINKYATNEFGNFIKLEADKETRVYKWLIDNPHRLGNVEHVPYYETPSQYLEMRDFYEIEKIENKKIENQLLKLAQAKRVNNDIIEAQIEEDRECI